MSNKNIPIITGNYKDPETAEKMKKGVFVITVITVINFRKREKKIEINVPGNVLAEMVKAKNTNDSIIVFHNGKVGVHILSEAIDKIEVRKEY